MCLRPTETSFFTTGQIYACVYETPGSIVKKGGKLHLPVSKVTQTRMHANSDTHTHLRKHMGELQEDAISFTSIDALFK